MDMNKITLLGRLTKDPELKYTTSGNAVCKFSIAVNRQKKKNEEKEQADFFNIVAWDKTAEMVQKWLSRGKRVLVNGRIENRSWDKPDGGKGFASEIVADSFGGIQIIDWPEKGTTHGEQVNNTPPAEDNFYDNSGFNPSPVDPNEPGF